MFYYFFRAEILFIGAAILGYFVNHELSGKNKIFKNRIMKDVQLTKLLYLHGNRIIIIL